MQLRSSYTTVILVIATAVVSCDAVSPTSRCKNTPLTEAHKKYAACRLAGVYQMANVTFTAIRDLAALGSAKINRVKLQVDEMLGTAGALEDKDIMRQVEEAIRAANLAYDLVYRTMIVVKEAKGVMDRSWRDSHWVFVFSGLKSFEKLLVNLTSCEVDYSLKYLSLERAWWDIRANASRLAEWKAGTMKAWDEEAERTWPELSELGLCPFKSHWTKTWSTLRTFLDGVTVPLVEANFSLVKAEKVANDTVQSVLKRAEAVNQVLKEEHSVLCAASKKLSTLFPVFDNLKERVLKNAAEVDALHRTARKNAQMFEKFTTALRAVIPRTGTSPPTNMMPGSRSKVWVLHVDSVDSDAKKVAVEVNAVMEDIKQTEKEVEVVLTSLRARLAAVKERSAAIVDETEVITGECDPSAEKETTKTLEVAIAELPDELMLQNGMAKFRDNVGPIFVKLKRLQQTLLEVGRNTERAKSEVDKMQVEMKSAEEAIKNKLMGKWKTLCEVRGHLSAMEKYHSSLDKRVQEVQLGAREAVKQRELAKKGAEMVLKDMLVFASASTRVETAIAQAAESVDTAEAGVMKGVEGSRAAAAAARTAAKMAVDERHRAEEIGIYMKEIQKNAELAVKLAQNSAQLALTGNVTAFKAMDNMASAMENIENVFKKVEKSFEDVFISLPELKLNENLRKCASVSTIDGDGNAFQKYSNAAKELLMFVSESEKENVEAYIDAFRTGAKEVNEAMSNVSESTAKTVSHAERVRELRALSRVSARASQEAARRAVSSALEAREAASLVAPGCQPLYKQLFDALLERG
ncbi:hypothetical protein ERJ75_000086800 [Trypanosoma vivax]|uniref:Uncharacterized protein n=1 Tax=Trypanosoma vivax (strain Y486) TaxID=1055687 RepID=F9WRD4_TRYVY|nr:hypothetical protein ERJ75_000086800 [Trypanosoma vivax]CCD20118.1 hypothetical protein, conserved in T. vivax [Trypanosoma vivax Y486]|eukprot:CCD20118.1 hypothetical protein, conserved in T. vivax [Trypanosoma vivax Y486]